MQTLDLIVIYFLPDSRQNVSTLQKYIDACRVRVCGMYSNHCASNVSVVQVIFFLILQRVAFWEKGKNELVGINVVHESCVGLSWRKLEIQILCEVEFAVCGQSVLVSLVEGLIPNLSLTAKQLIRLWLCDLTSH